MKELMLAIAGGGAKEGLLWVLVLFLVCFGAVHAGRLALLGWRAVKSTPQNETSSPEKQEKTNENRPEKASPQDEEKGGKADEPRGKVDETRGKTDETPAPVYLLVEKKRVRKKPKYEEPKRIDLKE